MPHDVKGEVAWLFCVPSAGANPDAAEIADHVAVALGKAFRPARVLFVGALPKTRSAKIVRRAVRAMALGTDLGDLSALAKPRRARRNRASGERRRVSPDDGATRAGRAAARPRIAE